MKPANSAANLSNRDRHLVALWRAYVAHDSARQADKWLAAYFREHKAYGKRDRAWYSEEFFQLLRSAIQTLPIEKTTDARMVWGELSRLASSPALLPAGERSLISPLSPRERGIGGEAIHAAGLPQTWLSWLTNSSLPGEAIPQFLQNLRTKPPLYMRANHTDKTGEIEMDLKAAGFSVVTTRHDSGLVTFAVAGRRPIYELTSIKNGLVEIQDLASQLLGEAVDAHPGMAVWDVCAGGGGKTMQIASQMLSPVRGNSQRLSPVRGNRSRQTRGVIYASDIRDYKLDELKLRARRGGFHNVRRFVYDAQQAPNLTREIQNTCGFHRILVDAPCSASGTLRRNPDVRYRIMPEDPEKFAALQLKILNAVHPQLKKSGKLIYTTCSVFRAENEEVVEKFLLGNTGFSLVKSACIGSPQLDSDTMFYAVLVKN